MKILYTEVEDIVEGLLKHSKDVPLELNKYLYLLISDYEDKIEELENLVEVHGNALGNLEEELDNEGDVIIECNKRIKELEKSLNFKSTEVELLLNRIAILESRL